MISSIRCNKEGELEIDFSERPMILRTYIFIYSSVIVGLEFEEHSNLDKRIRK